MWKNNDERTKFLKSMRETWYTLTPAGMDELGYEELKKMETMFNDDIDKINAPHQNAHWIWEEQTSKAIFDFAVKIYGGPMGKYTFPQYISMMYGWVRNVVSDLS